MSLLLWPIPNAFAEEQLSWMNEIKKLFQIEDKNIAYPHNRFDWIYEKALENYENAKYEESISLLESYVDRVFIYDCKWLKLLAENYKKLEDSNNEKAFTEIAIFCEMAVSKIIDDWAFQNQINVIRKLRIQNPNNPFILIYSNYISFRHTKEKLIQDELWKDYITYNLLNALDETRWNESFKDYDISRYKKLLEEDDYVYKTVLLWSLWVKYQIYDLVEKSLSYEELILSKWTYKSSHHNAYNYLANESLDPKESLYYSLKSLSYDMSLLDWYQKILLPVVFNTKIFENDEIFLKISNILNEDANNFFNGLNKLFASSDKSYDDIDVFLNTYVIWWKLTWVKAEEILEYIYNRLITIYWETKTCQILDLSLDDRTKNAYILIIPALEKCLNVDYKKVEKELAKYNTGDDAKEKTLRNTSWSFTYIISIILFLALFAFIVFIYMRKK